MLDQFPVEIVHNIASHLSTASSIINLSLTNKRLHSQLGGEDFDTFRSFVRRQFPTIRTPPIWKEVACILTTRSRAWDRRAFIAKAVEPPPDLLSPSHYERPRGPSIGYAPVIDSYEAWHGPRWADKNQVLVWGAAGRLMLRVNGPDSTTWHSHRVPNDHLPENDILDIRLLRSERRRDDNKQVILRRANNEIIKLELKPDHDEFQRRTLFDTMGLAAESMDVSLGSEPLLAVCNPGSIQIFDGNADDQLTKPISTMTIQQDRAHNPRSRCATFLSSERLAVGVQYTEGKRTAPVNIYRVMPDGSSAFPELCLPSSSGHASKEKGGNRTNANTVKPLDDVASLSGRVGEVFLSGWSDGVVRLYDIRSPTKASIDFHDGVDDGQILSLLPIGHERFLAGSFQNSLLKTFDLRMPGAKVYSYSNSGTSSSAVSAHGPSTSTIAQPLNQKIGPVDEAMKRQLSIFLAIRVNYPTRLWQSLPRQHLTHLHRYRGPVYSLSTPSPASPTVYAGVENYIIQLDFVSTDDVQKGRQDLSTIGLDYEKKSKQQILNLSCYERPRPGYESTDTVLLRNQVPWNGSRVEDGVTEDGWDERWRLATRRKLQCTARRGRH